MRDVAIIKDELEKAKKLLAETDEADVFNLTRYEDRVQTLTEELEKATAKPRVITTVDAPKGRIHYTRNRRRIHDGSFTI